METKCLKFLYVQKCWLVTITVNDSFSGYKIPESHFVFWGLTTKVSPYCLLKANVAVLKSEANFFSPPSYVRGTWLPQNSSSVKSYKCTRSCLSTFPWILCDLQYIQAFYFQEDLLNRIFKYSLCPLPVYLFCHFLVNPFKLFIYFHFIFFSFFPIIVFSFLFLSLFLGMSYFLCAAFNFVFISIMVLLIYF